MGMCWVHQIAVNKKYRPTQFQIDGKILWVKIVLKKNTYIINSCYWINSCYSERERDKHRGIDSPYRKFIRTITGRV